MHNPWVCVSCRIQGEPFQPEGASTECHSASFCQTQRAPFSCSLRTSQNWNKVRKFSRIMERKLAGTSKLEICKTGTASCMRASKCVYHCGMALHTTSAHTLFCTSVKLGSAQAICPDCQPTAVTRDSSPTLLKLCVWANQAAVQETLLLSPLPPGDRRTAS